MTEHTPGPWEVEGPVGYDTPYTDSRMTQWNVTGRIGGKDHRTIAEVGNWQDRPNGLDDALLIAAAPDLLEALTYIEDLLGDVEQFGNDTPLSSDLVENARAHARAAINKATKEPMVKEKM